MKDTRKTEKERLVLRNADKRWHQAVSKAVLDVGQLEQKGQDLLKPE